MVASCMPGDDVCREFTGYPVDARQLLSRESAIVKRDFEGELQHRLEILPTPVVFFCTCGWYR